MAGRRRIQRRVRVTLAACLMAMAAVSVVTAVVLSWMVWLAALFGVAAGIAATRIMYSEVTQTRWEAARERSSQARSFRAAMDQRHDEHQAYSALMAGAVRERDRTVAELGGTLRLLERRAEDAEARVRREARRANDAQQRLADLLDEVLGTVDPDAESDLLARGLPTVVDLVGWDAKVTDAREPSGEGAVA